ncbi:UNVERIFIED_CONTAM: hypothetical protein GTU68_016329 [Idotea baltica]|nr:hypothetical protein [Idotea baltica]
MANLHTESFGAGRVAKNVKVEPRDVPKRPPTVIGQVQPSPPPVTPPNTADFFGAAETPSTPAPSPEDSPAPPPTPAPTPAPEPVAEPAAPTGFQIRFAISDCDVATDGDSDLLDLAEVNGIEIDYSCRSGSCQSCRVKCTSGEVEMDDADLEDDERAEGWILPCVAYPKSDLTIEA